MTLNRLQELTQLMQGRIEWKDALPADVVSADEAALAQGVESQGRIWHKLGNRHHHLYCVHAPGTVTETELQLLRLLLAESGTEVLNRRPLWEEKIEQALHEPLEAFAGPVLIEDEWETIAVPWTWPVFCIGLRLTDRQSQSQTAEVRNLLETLGDPAGITPYITVDDSLILVIFPLLSQDRDEDAQLGEETARAIVHGLISETFLDARAVWSKALHSFPELLRTVRRMLFVAHAAEGLTPDSRVISDRGLGALELLYSARTQFRQAYADHILPPGALVALGSELEQTVMMFVAYDLNISETARQLYLHRNSLLYRIERIRDMTGYDIRHFVDAVTVWTALLLKRL